MHLSPCGVGCCPFDGSVVVNLLLLSLWGGGGLCVCSLLCYAILYVLSNLVLQSLFGNRELVALL